MQPFTVEAAATIDAQPDVIWNILTDYHNGHPRILPRGFGGLRVEESADGAPVVIRFWVRTFGVTRHFRHLVTIPEPGRVLEESDSANGTRTTFVLTPLDGGHRTRVRIVTEMATPSGPLGGVQRALTSFMLRRMYREELRRLAALAANRGSSGTAAAIHQP